MLNNFLDGLVATVERLEKGSAFCRSSFVRSKTLQMLHASVQRDVEIGDLPEFPYIDEDLYNGVSWDFEAWAARFVNHILTPAHPRRGKERVTMYLHKRVDGAPTYISTRPDMLVIATYEVDHGARTITETTTARD